MYTVLNVPAQICLADFRGRFAVAGGALFKDTKLCERLQVCYTLLGLLHSCYPKEGVTTKASSLALNQRTFNHVGCS